jgi:peptide/nickel transport system substrate-binding protein
MHKRISLLSWLVLFSVLLAACGPAPIETDTAPPSGPEPSPEAGPPAEPVVLRVGWLEAPDTLNLAYAFLTESYIVFDLVYAALTVQAPTGEYVGHLAQEWSHTDDGLTWNVTLKDGITWHNGEALTAADMAWAINAVMENPDGWAATSNYVAGFSEVTATDDKHLTITTEYPVSNMEYRLSWLYAVYPPDFEAFTGVEDLQNFNNLEIIGAGPFKINVFDQDARVLILDTYEDYFGGRAKIDQIIFQAFDNADAMSQALKVGDIDLVLEPPQSAFPAFSAMEDVQPVRIAGSYFDELIINSVPADHDPAPNKNPALDDPAVRLAIAYAINKQDITEVVMQGLATPGDTIVPPGLGGGYWHNEDIEDIPFDLAQANQVLETAGYLRGTDGGRARGDARLDFRLQFGQLRLPAWRHDDGWFSDRNSDRRGRRL